MNWKNSVWALALIVGGMAASAAQANDTQPAVIGAIDVTVESRNSSGTLVAVEQYNVTFELAESGFFFQDFSTRTRFKFFTASLEKVDGVYTVTLDWFADVTVFNSVDLTTSLVFGNGQKSDHTEGVSTVYTSSGSTRTKFSAIAIEE